MPPNQLLLVRHAQSTWNATGRWQGQADPPLSAWGEHQALELAERFVAAEGGAAEVTHVLTSDLARARATAGPLAARLGLEPIVDVDLREIDVGSWSGMTREEIRAQDGGEGLDRYFRGEAGWTGGERIAEHDARCARAAARISRLAPADAVVVVTHGGTLRALLLALLGLDPAARSRLTGIGHASRTRLLRGIDGDDHWRLNTFNLPL